MSKRSKKFHRIYTTHDPAAPPEMATGWICWHIVNSVKGWKTRGTWHATEAEALKAAREFGDCAGVIVRVAVRPADAPNPFGTRIPSAFRLARNGRLTAEAITALKADAAAEEARKAGKRGVA